MKKRGESIHCSLYIPAEIVAEILAEADRQDRPVGWIIREAVKIGMPKLKAFGDRCAAANRGQR